MRWVMAVIAHFVTTFSLIDHADGVPEEIRAVIDAASHTRQWKLLSRLSSWLCDSLRRSNKVLRVTHRERARAWKSAIITAHLAGQNEGMVRATWQRNETHGVPSDPDQLQHIYDVLTETNPEMTLGDDANLQNLLDRSRTVAPQIRSRRRTNEPKAELTDSDESSAEEVDIPEFSSSELGESSKSNVSSVGNFEQQQLNFANSSFIIRK